MCTAHACTNDVQQLANDLVGFQTRLASCGSNDANTICDSESECRAAIRDYFAYVEECAEQISGANVDFSTLLQFYENLLESLCDLDPEDLANLYFGFCANSETLIAASNVYVSFIPLLSQAIDY